MTEKKEAPKRKKTTKAKPRKAAPKKPDYPAILDMKVPEFKVGTPEYAELIRMGNSLFNTVWNTHRVRPAVFYGIYKKLRDHYNVPTNVK